MSTISTVIGFLIINSFLSIYLATNDQSNGFPRSLLRYIPGSTTSWNYPDLNTIKEKKLILIGDSYGEGAGDAFLNNKYNYSSSHFINKNSDYQIILASNSGSYLPLQILHLEEALNGNYFPNKIFKNFSKGKEKINLLAFFYEGNDLENVIQNKDNFNEFFSKKQRFKRLLNKRLPLIGFVGRLLLKTQEFLVEISSNKSPKNNSNFNTICIGQKCRKFPPMQSATPEINKNQINNSIDFTSNSLINFKTKYNANICVIYIPSPATIYSPEIIYYQERFKTKNGFILSSENQKKSEYIKNRLSSNLKKGEIKFHDSTNFLKKYSEEEFIHGIKDTKHFNQKGYNLLATFIIPKLKTCVH